MSVRTEISLTQTAHDWLSAQIANGKFRDQSEVVAALIQQAQAKEKLNAELQAGIDSGISEKTVPQIMKSVEARLKADGRL